MDKVIPLLTLYNGYIISITNEADNNFGNDETPQLHQEILAFLKGVKPHIHAINEKMAVTITIAEGSIHQNSKKGIPEIIAECDVASFNFYGSKHSAFQSPYFKAKSKKEIEKDIKNMLNISGKKNIVIQELGMHTGSGKLDGSEIIQKEFFELFFKEMKKEPRIKTAYVFQLVDWSPEVTNIFEELFIEEGISQEFMDEYVESLATIGLINYSNGKRKLAWSEFIKAVQEFH